LLRPRADARSLHGSDGGSPLRAGACRAFPGKRKAAADGGFEVRLARSNRTIAIEAGKTILDALLDAGIAVNYACTEGVCGTCETRVIEGIPDHRDLFLGKDEQAANRTMMICCSGAKSRTLVLDL
jgi:tetrachlorobenzoquinone reductase